MSKKLISDAKNIISGKSGVLDDEETEFLAKEFTKLGFKLGFARAYAAGPKIMQRLVKELEEKELQYSTIRKIVGNKAA